MKQKIPSITGFDIDRIVKRDFSQLNLAEILDILGEYKSESNNGRNRVYASILKLADGDIELLRKYANRAVDDYRDVIALAEYPKYSKHAFDDLSHNEEQQLIDDDWQEFQIWFNKT